MLVHKFILMGKAVGNMSAREYHKGYSLKAFDTVKEAIRRLEERFDMMVIEVQAVQQK